MRALPTAHAHRVQAASAEEAAHEGYLDELDKAMKGPCLWRQNAAGGGMSARRHWRWCQPPAATATGQAIPQQYTLLAGQPLLAHTPGRAVRRAAMIKCGW